MLPPARSARPAQRRQRAGQADPPRGAALHRLPGRDPARRVARLSTPSSVAQVSAFTARQRPGVSGPDPGLFRSQPVEQHQQHGQAAVGRDLLPIPAAAFGEFLCQGGFTLPGQV